MKSFILWFATHFYSMVNTGWLMQLDWHIDSQIILDQTDQTVHEQYYTKDEIGKSSTKGTAIGNIPNT